MKEQEKRLLNSIRKVNKAEEKRRIATMERLWISDTPKLNFFNYWWYRYFTNEFLVYVLDAIEFREVQEKKQ